MPNVWNAPATIERLAAEIDKIVQEAVTEYVSGGFLMLTRDGALGVEFTVADPLDDITKERTLKELLCLELEAFRWGPPNAEGYFYNPAHSDQPAHVALCQDLLRVLEKHAAITPLSEEKAET
jgi:hypothetical protein